MKPNLNIIYGILLFSVYRNMKKNVFFTEFLALNIENSVKNLKKSNNY
jgi:hypothetical protein